jgi:glycosyltransferase involved in cell wall biosynthesis
MACGLPVFILQKRNDMRIAQVAPLHEAVPPLMYGGTERVVYYLVEELVAGGHEVTLFASGDSKTSARLVPIVRQALRLDPHCVDPLAHHIVQLEEVMDRQNEFDIIHFHTDYIHFPVSIHCTTPCLTTLHGRLDIPDLLPVYQKFPLQRVVSISDNQRLPLSKANWIGTVYHGLPPGLHPLQQQEGNYLAFIGRVSPEKGVDKAIEIAIGCNCPIKVAAKVDKVDQSYFEKHIAHLMDHPLVEFIGEINEEQKTGFLGNAKALLFPIDWEEPFGIAMIEAMSCGTPVIAFRRGSVPEVIDDGVTGFIVESISQAVEAVKKIKTLCNTTIRKVFEEKFTAARMAEDYLKIYRSLYKGQMPAMAKVQNSHHL